MRPQKHDTFSKEFREEAIRQAREGTQSLSSLARLLGVKYSTLRLWEKQVDEERPDRPAQTWSPRIAASAPKTGAPTRARSLKKATAFFAKHSK
jgi:transposase-like protein